MPGPCTAAGQDRPRVLLGYLTGETEAWHSCRVWHQPIRQQPAPPGWWRGGSWALPSPCPLWVLAVPLSTGLTLVPAPQDLSRKDGLEVPSSSLGELPPASTKLSTSPSAVGTHKRPTSLSRHASAAGFPLTAAAPRAVPKGHKSPMSYSPMDGGEGPFIDTEDISQLLTDVARFADALEKLRDVVLRDGECRGVASFRHPCRGTARHHQGEGQEQPLCADSPDPRVGISAPGPGGDRDPQGAVWSHGQKVVGGRQLSEPG